MAVARGSAVATGQMVLCVGAQTVTVYTDATGRPTQAPHLCSDCALSIVAVAATMHVAAPQLITAVYVPRRIVSVHIPILGGMTPQPRGPPQSV